MLYHNNPETFKCLSCNRTYACEANLRSHNRKTLSYRNFSTHRWAMHNRQKSYTCQICGESFRLASMLRNHLDGHAAHKQVHHDQQGIESKFKRRLTHACSWCSEKFAYASCLKIHMQKVHPGKRMQKSRISCTLCPLKFSNPLHFRLHLRKKHGKTSLEIKEEFAEEDAEDSM
ncbi:oocyte zinc finger protein XlCOF22-like [Stomoxys calcitrans]|uniref:oocyte zinc finger protein XlCOF22-like n=1 Tax=Stomoxys calcitrans TaxID=35570 RepID=UPI0027E2C423|nr:oocyte zinc finger protein XlCOF22-like [Stomoxys calcitrans]